jgi:hypothetical protein
MRERREEVVSGQEIGNEWLERVRSVIRAEQDHLAACVKQVSFVRGKNIPITAVEPLKGVPEWYITE